MADLVLSQVTVDYTSGGNVVRPIDQFDLTVPAGSLALLLGPSGCGKTTLLSAVAGILKPASGSIRYGDTEIIGLSGDELLHHRQHRVGIVFQAFNLVPSLTAAENVMIPLVTSGVRRKEARQRAVELLSSVGLSERLKHHPNQLSGGQQQRVAIARALALDPPLILADEPTAHLDHVQVEGVLRIIRGLTDGGRVVVVATHDERMVALADLVVELAPRFADAVLGPEERTLAPGDVLFREGTRGERIYVVEDGEIEIVTERYGDGERVVNVCRRGDYFGEMGPLFSLPRSATARGRTEARVVGYTLKDFKERFGLATVEGLLRRGPDHVPEHHAAG